MFDVRVRGADDFARVAKRLRQVGNKELRSELYKGINRAVKPLTQSVKDSTDDFLPQRYARELSASLKVTTRRRAGRNPAIFLVGKAKTPGGKERDLASLNRGRLRHPLFGDRRHWFNQRIRRDWWDDPLIAGSPIVRKEISRVIRDIERKLNRAV